MAAYLLKDPPSGDPFPVADQEPADPFVEVHDEVMGRGENVPLL